MILSENRFLFGIMRPALTTFTCRLLVEARISGSFGEHGLDVGDRLRVTLASVDVEQGFIDFVRS
jgi:hypothetical protein